MSLEQQRKENRRELAQRDEELEDVRCNAHKKVKGKQWYLLQIREMIIEVGWPVLKPLDKRGR
jgi:hypothetical protein